MQTIVGVKNASILAINTTQFYRELLYYDKFLFHEPAINNIYKHAAEDKRFNKLFEWLKKDGSILALSANAFKNKAKIKEADELLKKEFKKRTKTYEKVGFRMEGYTVIPINEEFELEEVKIRLTADLVQKLQPNFQIYPISYSLFNEKEILNKRKEVLKLVVNSFPIPDRHISFEQIKDFKEDPDTRHKFLALKNWINKTSRSLTPLNEIQDEFEYLLEEYKKNYTIHKLKHSKGTLQIVTEACLEAIENIARLKFSNLSKTIFKMEQIAIEELESEQKLEGREIAYIVKAQKNLMP